MTRLFRALVSGVGPSETRRAPVGEDEDPRQTLFDRPLLGVPSVAQETDGGRKGSPTVVTVSWWFRVGTSVSGPHDFYLPLSVSQCHGPTSDTSLVTPGVSRTTTLYAPVLAPLWSPHTDPGVLRRYVCTSARSGDPP